MLAIFSCPFFGKNGWTSLSIYWNTMASHLKFPIYRNKLDCKRYFNEFFQWKIELPFATAFLSIFPPGIFYPAIKLKPFQRWATCPAIPLRSQSFAAIFGVQRKAHFQEIFRWIKIQHWLLYMVYTNFWKWFSLTFHRHQKQTSLTVTFNNTVRSINQSLKPFTWKLKAHRRNMRSSARRRRPC